MALPMLLRQITLENLLSFRKTTVELRGLNVLIGANAAGKSNLVEAIGLLQAAPTDLNSAVLQQGGARAICSLAGAVASPPAASPIAAMECSGLMGESLQYRLEFSEEARGFIIIGERLNSIPVDIDLTAPEIYFERTPGSVRLGPGSSKFEALRAAVSQIPSTQSVFALYKNPGDTTPITRVGRNFEDIRIYREFRTTGNSGARTGVSTSMRKEYLYDGADNLALVLLEMDFKGLHDRVRAYLHRFCDRFTDVKVRLDGPIAKTYIEETGLLEPLVSSRLSDGTLKFLSLLAALLYPGIGPLVCIEEPEVGLHPEAIQIVAEALVDASERTQLIVTTHSEALIDALSERPEDVLVTERDFENGTQFKRLDRERLSSWLERYTLGALWRKGELGGTRW
jgi:predicted ATPase